ncbi:hydroxymethylbilane synthase [Glaciihabitans sp. UYNi722]|uniref:hydroxymethylbilane synthase n=1 Tax=Glaciihabitans sp. UYNi722 TaxID=3156344 RepID=UPI00339950BD
MSSAPGSIRIGTRGSALAIAQTGAIAESIAKTSGLPLEIVTIATEGDHSKAPLASLGGTGVFASALREALLREECDLVVHSLKDLPTTPYAGLRIGAIPKRADARDVLCARDDLTLDGLEPGARVGTGSPRRAAQLRGSRSDVEVVDIRGNVDTRLGRIGTDLDAVVLAAAGLSRLGRLDAVTEFFELGRWATAPGQGALGIEVRDSYSSDFAAILKSIDHTSSRLCALAERAVLRRFEAGCAAPIGASAVVDGEMLFLTATVYVSDGSGSLTSSHALVIEGSAAERALLPDDLGDRVADELLRLGAADIAPLGVSS